MYPNTIPRYFLGLKPVFNKVWPGRIVASLVFFVVSIGILGIYTLQISPALVFDSKFLSSGSEYKIQTIEDLTLDTPFFRDLPEFFSPAGEADWWKMHERVYGLLETKGKVEVALSRDGEDSLKSQAQVGFIPFFVILKKTWLIYLVAAIYLITAISVYRRHETTPGLILTIFFLACSAYFASSAPVVSRVVTLHPTSFKFLTKALHLSAGGLITLVHFAFVFPEPKPILKKYPWLPYFLYGYFFLAAFLYFSGITAFGTTFPFFCVWVLVIVGAFLHSLIQERDPFFKKQISLSLTAPILASLFFVIFFLLPGVLGLPPIQFTYFALLSLVIPSTLPSAMDNLQLYRAGLEKERLAQEDKERLRQDLHDLILNNLAIIILASEAALTQFDKDPALAGTKLRLIHNLAADSSRQLREFLQVIDESDNSWETFCGNLRKFAHDLVEARCVAFEINTANPPTGLPPPSLQLRVCLYHVYREALLNAIRHSGATAVKGVLFFEADHVICRIEDNGRGFDPGRETPGHYGIKNMKRRVQALGGVLNIESSIGEGTVITFRLPSR